MKSIKLCCVIGIMNLVLLFNPSGKEQRITIVSANVTKDIKLTKGLWQYNCTGMFKDGRNIQILGTWKTCF